MNKPQAFIQAVLADFGLNLEASKDFLWLSHAQHDSELELAVKDQNGYLYRANVYNPDVEKLPTFVIGFGRVNVYDSGNMYLAPGKAYLRAERLEPYIKLVQAIPNTLEALGLEDLPQALQALAGLKHGQTSVFNDIYSLARGNVYALRRGPIISLELDGKLMLSERVSFVTPSGKRATAYVHPMHFWDDEVWLEITVENKIHQDYFNMLEGSVVPV
jgi:hypothetical protein